MRIATAAALPLVCAVLAPLSTAPAPPFDPQICHLTIDPRRGPPDPAFDPRFHGAKLNTTFDFEGIERWFFYESGGYRSRKPFVVENLLSPAEIKQIMRAASATELLRPTVNKNGDVISFFMTRSDVTGKIWLPDTSARLLFQRLREQLPEDHGMMETFRDIYYLHNSARVSRYYGRGSFKAHYDGAFRGSSLVTRFGVPWSSHTLLIYLNNVSVGGETRFANVETWRKVDVPARAGRAVVFDHEVLHSGQPVGEGEEKWILKIEIMHGSRPVDLCRGCVD
ncbi:hypothetical protein HDU86_005617 [Geranomyces michiganensis]|nr:hypothetical protein HDU86_005617 [Geranomyces michiganensis]